MFRLAIANTHDIHTSVSDRASKGTDTYVLVLPVLLLPARAEKTLLTISWGGDLHTHTRTHIISIIYRNKKLKQKYSCTFVSP